MQLQQELRDTQISLLVSKVLEPRQTSLRVSVLRSPAVCHSWEHRRLGSAALTTWQEEFGAGKGSFAQCLPAGPQSLAQVLLPRRTSTRNPLKVVNPVVNPSTRTYHPAEPPWHFGDSSWLCSLLTPWYWCTNASWRRYGR